MGKLSDALELGGEKADKGSFGCNLGPLRRTPMLGDGGVCSVMSVESKIDLIVVMMATTVLAPHLAMDSRHEQPPH